MKSFNTINLQIRGKVGVITLDRPKQLNALNDELMDEITLALDICEADSAIGCVVITGNEKAFAAGADIKAMVSLDFISAYSGDFITRNWERLKSFRKPTIAAVSGLALGGGCELAMMCDIIFASETAKFGQPEVKLGVLPGAGGTQRLPRAVGKAKAMELCLTGRLMDAIEAERAGLISRVIPGEQLLESTLDVANAIASHSLPVLMAIKECVNRAFETGLNEGLLFERRAFHSAFALDDRREGMSAFLEKRPAVFANR